MNTMIRAIIFDCFGVLYGGSLGYLASLAPAGRAQEVHDINLQKDYGYISYEDYLARTGEVIGKTPAEIEAILRQKHVRNQELIASVKTLKSSYKIGLLSNIGEKALDGLFSPEEQRQLFDVRVLSFEEGLAKPNPAIFRLIADRLEVSPSDCVMIDDLADNCEGAEIAGMYAVQHTTNERTQRELAKIIEKST